MIECIWILDISPASFFDLKIQGNEEDTGGLCDWNSGATCAVDDSSPDDSGAVHRGQWSTAVERGSWVQRVPLQVNDVHVTEL